MFCWKPDCKLELKLNSNTILFFFILTPNFRVKGLGGPPSKTDRDVHHLALECKFQMFGLA